MKVHTDAGNINCLKLLISCQLKSKDIEINVKPDDKFDSFLSRPRFPVLENDEGEYLISSNSAARLLFTPESESSSPCAIDEWLEWEATQFQPVVQSVCSNYAQQGKTKPDLLKLLQTTLTKLDSALSKNAGTAIVGHQLSLADVVLYCAVLPLFCEGSPLTEVVSAYRQVDQWFRQLATRPEIQKATSSLPGGASWSSIKTWLVTVPVTGSVRRPAELTTPASPVTPASKDSGQDDTNAGSSVTAEEIQAALDAWTAGRDQLGALRARQAPILPLAGEKNILITSALPYVNNVPHLGNIIGCVLSADTFARFCRLRNLNTLYICGTDEYGTATETKAMAEGLTPQQVCDKYHTLHRGIYDWFNISFDYFGRTTTEQQTEIAQDIFWKLNNKGYILKDSVDQLQCQQCDRFLADRFVEGVCPLCGYEDARGDQCDACGRLVNAVDLGRPRCKVCASTPVTRTSQHLFMDLPTLQPKLERHLESNFERGLWSANTRVITKSWLRDGLKPRCISRDLKWGTPVPLEGYTDKVFYVWYDAPIGYISITANYTKDWTKWWKNPKEVELYNFMAKDNVPFHSVIFPSTLLGTDDDWTIVNHLSATEYLNYEDGKFSKSRGVGVFGNDAQDTGIPADVWRFYLLFLRPESQDSTFSWDDFVTKNNSELLNNLGNFINRALMFVFNNFKGIIPEIVLTDDDKTLVAQVTKELQAYNENLSQIRLRDGLRNILSISRYGNQYLQANKPWVKVKGTPEERARAGTIVALAANVCCQLSVLIQPYMPAISDTIQRQLNVHNQTFALHDVFVPYLDKGHQIGKPSPLFQKIETSVIDDLKKRFAGKQSTGGSAVTVDRSPEEAARLTAAITDQGNVVRQLKSEKADKSKIDEEVRKLLELKKKLALIQAPPASSSTKKEKNKPKGKTTKGPEQAAKPAAAKPEVTDKVLVEKLTQAVSDQGQRVRQLKAQKVEKSALELEINKLLELKQQLAVAKGMDPQALIGSGGSKKKNKKN